MAFTYLPATALGRVRLLIGDVTEGEGPRPGPSATNFSDEEIGIFLAENDGKQYLAAAAACETLAVEWAGVPPTKSGPAMEQEDPTHTPSHFLRLAEMYRKKSAVRPTGFATVTSYR